MARKSEQLTVGRRRIAVSNLDKLLYPGTKVTKADVINYYINVSKYILPHLKDHPITLKRFPDGVFGESFYEKNAPAFTPEWVKTVPVPRRETPGPDIRYTLINDLPTLVWAANLATLEIHPFLHRASQLIEGNYYKGFLHFYLNGTKLKGEWTLQRFADGKDERDARDKWHLIKTDKNTRAVSMKRDDESALTKRR